MEDRRSKMEDSKTPLAGPGLNRILILLSLILFQYCLSAQVADTARLSLVFAGDIMGHDEQITGAHNPETGQYDYEPTFRLIRPFIEQADIAIANLEVTLAGPPYKGYPQFSSPDALALAIRDAGFDIMLLANNHALDRGQAGFIRTLLVLDSLQLLHTGTFPDPVSHNQQYPLILEKNSIRIALLNYTYGTNGITIPKPFIINRIDTFVIRRDLEKAKQAHPDFIIVTIHWGEEYQRIENPAQQKLASYILKHGAHAIIGSHPHVVQPIRYYPAADSTKQYLVVYSLGNFVSNQRARYKDGGIVVKINLIKTAGETRLEHSGYLPTWVYREDLPTRSVFYVVPITAYENDSTLMQLNDYDFFKLSQFASDIREHLKNFPETNYFSPPRPSSLVPRP
jgi:poly-gamma-glutamate synthesis protein (capsule biosynthesis protein)